MPKFINLADLLLLLIPRSLTLTYPILRTYKFYSVFPTNISQQDLSYDQADGTEEFTVTFQVQWWEADGNGGDVA